MIDFKPNAVPNRKQYSYVSRYEAFPYFYDAYNNRYYQGLQGNLDTNMSYALYTVEPGDTYDSIAYNYYGSSLFFWIICDFNRIHDALEQPEVGTQLKLPSLNSILFKE